jgi:apolipoprotein D and lipocalin family protein
MRSKTPLLFAASTLFTLLSPFWGTYAQAQPQKSAVSSIEKLDVARYMGVWHEIAKYPNSFQKQCASSTQASYRVLSESRLEVKNRCKTTQGNWSEAIGEAQQIGDASSAKLKVRFAPAWLSFLPMVWGNYWVIDIDPDYQWVIVSEPTREYLWILARTPTLPANTYQSILHKLTALDFDTTRLSVSPP